MSLSAELLDTYDFVWARLWSRLDGLTDAEYFWEPAPDCLTVRPTAEGRFRADLGEWPETRPARFSTIAWRMCHMADNFLEDRIGPLFGEDPDAPDPDRDHPATASEAVSYLEHAFRIWRAHLGRADDETLWGTLETSATPYLGRPLVRFVLQYLEEFAHHAAEVAILRDLYRARHGPLA